MLATAPAQAESAREAIDAANEKFAAAFNRGDGAAVGAMYATDAALLPPGEARVESRPAIEQYWQGVIDAGYKDFSLKALDVVPTQNGAAEVGRWSIAVPGAASAAGNYMVIWHHAKNVAGSFSATCGTRTLPQESLSFSRGRGSPPRPPIVQALLRLFCTPLAASATLSPAFLAAPLT
ncbi:MAG: DUF4440 domain-containing protein [Geminicoccaceae bacterium]